MADRRSSKGTEFVTESRMTARRAGTRMRVFDPERLLAELSPAANTLPSSKAPEVEVLPPEPVTVDDFIGAITQLWQDAQQRFLAIGDYLARARGALSPEQYALLKARLPFGKAVHSQLMMAYRAIKDGMLPETAAAAGYSVVYLAATLSDGERRQAMAEGVIRPDMRRSDLLAFRRRLRPAATRDTDLATLKRERERLLERVAEIDRQLQEVGAEP